KLHPPCSTPRDTDKRRTVDSDGIYDGDRISCELIGPVACWRAAGLATTATVECHNPKAVAGEVRNLSFPNAAVEEAPRWKEHQRALRIRRTEHLVEHSDAVDGIDPVAVGVRIECAHSRWSCLPFAELQ